MPITSRTAGSCLIIPRPVQHLRDALCDAPDGRSIATNIVPLSSSGTKPPGMVLNRNATPAMSAP